MTLFFLEKELILNLNVQIRLDSSLSTGWVKTQTVLFQPSRNDRRIIVLGRPCC